MPARRKRSRLTRRLIDLALERFHACEVCLKNEAFDFIEDALAPLRLSRRELDRLLRTLTCPCCGSEIRYGSYVAAPSAEQRRQWELSRRFDAVYGLQIRDFRDSLVKYPMLGANHTFGQILSKAMKRADRTFLEPSIWYRATGYSDQPSFGPRAQVEATRAYRYNQIGQVAWYLGSDQKTAAVEVLRKPISGTRVCTAKVRILEPLAVLDLRSVLWGNDPAKQWILRNVVDKRFVSEPTSEIEDTRPEYRVPQYVADLARRRNFRGILYDSTRPSAYNNPEAVGHNLVVFAPIPDHVIEDQQTVEFGVPDYDPFGLERWPLGPVPSTFSPPPLVL